MYCVLPEILSLLDRYTHRVEYKGGSRQLRAQNIVVTSICSPEECYKYQADEPIKQLLRRIDKIVELKDETEVEGNTSLDFITI